MALFSGLLSVLLAADLTVQAIDIAENVLVSLFNSAPIIIKHISWCARVCSYGFTMFGYSCFLKRMTWVSPFVFRGAHPFSQFCEIQSSKSRHGCFVLQVVYLEGLLPYAILFSLFSFH